MVSAVHKGEEAVEARGRESGQGGIEEGVAGTLSRWRCGQGEFQSRVQMAVEGEPAAATISPQILQGPSSRTPERTALHPSRRICRRQTNHTAKYITCVCYLHSGPSYRLEGKKCPANDSKHPRLETRLPADAADVKVNDLHQGRVKSHHRERSTGGCRNIADCML